jgi:hypothetical protein
MVTYSAQDPRHESTWLQVASSYAEALRTEIGSTGTQAELHIKQKRKEAAADVLTMLASHDRKDAVLQVTVYRVRSGTENTYYLMAQFMPLEYTRLSNGRRGMIPAQGVIKKYPILSTTTKDMRDASIPGLAKEFVRELRDQGHLL